MLVHYPGYLDTCIVIEDTDDDTVFVEVPLDRVAFELDPAEFIDSLDIGGIIDREIAIINTAPGVVQWSSEITTPGNEYPPPELLDTIFHWNAGEAVENRALYSIANTRERFYISGSGQEGELERIYVFNNEGQLIDEYAQPIHNAGWGMRDLTVYGDLLAGGDGTEIVFFDPDDGQEQSRIDGHIRCFNLTYDSDDDRFFAANRGQHRIMVLERDEEEYYLGDELDLRNPWLPDYVDWPQIYGMAWYANDPDSMSLYILHYNWHQIGGPYAWLLSKLNPATNESQPLRIISNESQCSGLSVVREWQPSLTALAFITGAEENQTAQLRFLAFESFWFSYEPAFGEILRGERGSIRMTLNATDLYYAEFGFDLLIHARGGVEAVFPVRLRVCPLDVLNEPDPLPKELTLSQPYPNPFNSTTIIKYCLPRSGEVCINIYDIHGRSMDSWDYEFDTAGQHKIVIDAGNWSSGIYLIGLEAGGEKRFVKMILVK